MAQTTLRSRHEKARPARLQQLADREISKLKTEQRERESKRELNKLSAWSARPH